MKTGDLAVYIPENLLVIIVVADYSESGGVIRHKVRPANNKKADTRILPADKFRPATPEDEEFIIYEYADEETGQISSLKLDKTYIKAVGRFLLLGKDNAITTKEILELVNRPDTDSTRRQFRAAVSYWILEKNVLICSTSDGFFVAANASEVEECLANKERQAEGILKRARLLKSMDIESSKQVFQRYQSCSSI